MSNQIKASPTLKKELSLYLNSLPFIGKSVEENPYGYGKDGLELVEVLAECGYMVEAHQGGIQGTTLLLVPMIPRGSN